MDLELDLRWRLGDLPALEEGLLPVLEALAESGSLRAAAARAGCSYRHAWGLLKRFEQRLGAALAVLEQGRGSRLTPLGRAVLAQHRRVGARLGPLLAEIAGETAEVLRAAARERSAAAPVRLAASHDLALAALAPVVEAGHAGGVELRFRGSVESLRALAEGRCDLAGFHLPEGRLGAALAARYRVWLRPGSHRLVHLARRWQGLLTRPGAPAMGSVSDLAAHGARFVNRQPDSGTRLLFDLLREEAGVPPGSIAGYEVEEFTHLAVAAMVASGGADAGFGIHAAAARFHLEFVPLVRERYWLAVRAEALDTSGVAALVRAASGAAFRRAVDALPGYDAARAGTVCALSEMV